LHCKTLKGLIANKVSFAKLGERRYRDKEEQLKTFLEVQKRSSKLMRPMHF
jgi:hypothetical protein